MKRNNIINTRWSDKEKEQVKKLAKAQGLPIASLIRTIVIRKCNETLIDGKEKNQ